MELYSLTYTSRARPNLAPKDVDAIHRAALTYNPLDGVTGILLFNGEAFMQIIEGAESAIDDLFTRLSNDERHHSIEVRDRRVIEKRFFPEWSMYRLDIPNSYSGGMATIEDAVTDRIDDDLRTVVDQSVAAISTPTDED